MGVIDKLKLALEAKKVADATGGARDVDWARTLEVTLYDLLRTGAGLAVAAAVGYYVDPEHLKALLSHLPEQVEVAAIPLVSALLKLFAHWWNEKYPVWAVADRREEKP